MSITVELPMETGELVEKALDKARDKARDDSVSGVEFVDESWSARQADALVSMASAYLSGNAGQTRNTSDDYLVTIHVDQSALAHGNGRASLPIESVKRLCCDGHAVVLGEDEKGEPLNIGRKTRTVPTAIKRALVARDKQHSCQPRTKNQSATILTFYRYSEGGLGPPAARPVSTT